jgi:hypothetical protein
MKDQLDILANAKLPPQQTSPDAKNLMTPGGVAFGMNVEARMGGMIPGCTPKNGTQLRFLVESECVCVYVCLYIYMCAFYIIFFLMPVPSCCFAFSSIFSLLSFSLSLPSFLKFFLHSHSLTHTQHTQTHTQTPPAPLLLSFLEGTTRSPPSSL